MPKRAIKVLTNKLTEIEGPVFTGKLYIYLKSI
jgi:hypothetical protein